MHGAPPGADKRVTLDALRRLSSRAIRPEGRLTMLYDAWADDIRRWWDGATAAHGWGVWEIAAQPDGTGWRIVTLSGDVVASGVRDERTARLLAAVPDLCEPSLRPVDIDPGGVGVLPVAFDAAIVDAAADAEDRGYDEGWEEGVGEGYRRALDLDDGWHLVGARRGHRTVIHRIDPSATRARAALEEVRPAVLATLAALADKGTLNPEAVVDVVLDAVTQWGTR